jgi:large subunit ribosomal protein L15
VEINLDVLEKNFADKDKITPQILVEKGLIKLNKRSRARKLARVKILGSGKILKALTIEGCLVSQGAKTAIEKAGGGIVENEKKL